MRWIETALFGLMLVVLAALELLPILPAPAAEPAAPAPVARSPTHPAVAPPPQPTPSTSSGRYAQRRRPALRRLPPRSCRRLLGPQMLTSTSGPEDWAMEGNNPSRTRSTDAQLALPLSQQREVQLTADTGDGSPLTIARGIMLVESEHLLRAFDLRDGTQRWSFPLRRNLCLARRRRQVCLYSLRVGQQRPDVGAGYRQRQDSCGPSRPSV